MALDTSCGNGRFSNFSIDKLLEKDSSERDEKGGEWEENCSIKEEKIDLLGGRAIRQGPITQTKQPAPKQQRTITK